jgi:hypothetical protein
MTWRSLGDSNPCFRRERATPTDCGPFSELVYRSIARVVGPRSHVDPPGGARNRLQRST